MNRWERFWWAYHQARVYGRRFAFKQAWRFATAPGRIFARTRQVEREFARTVLKEHNKRGA